MKFELYFADLNKNFRVLVDSVVHPRLCGLKDIEEARQATKTFFPEFSDFDNIVHGDLYYTDGEMTTKESAIQQLEYALSVIRATPANKIAEMTIDASIRFTSGSAAGKYAP